MRLLLLCVLFEAAKVTHQSAGVGWSDASWPGISADLKPASATTWNTPPDLSQMMMTAKKVS